MGFGTDKPQAIVLSFKEQDGVWQVYQSKRNHTKAVALSFLFLDQALEYVKRLANAVEAKRENPVQAV